MSSTNRRLYLKSVKKESHAILINFVLSAGLIEFGIRSKYIVFFVKINVLGSFIFCANMWCEGQ